jgi:hypothetical protein
MTAMPRRKLSLPATLSERLVEAVGAGVITTLVLVAAIELPRLPEAVPLDFDADGRADAWGAPRVLALLPGVAFIVYVALSVLQRFPEAFDYRAAVTEANAPVLYRKGRWLVRGVKIVLTLVAATFFLILMNTAHQSTGVYEICWTLTDEGWRPERCLRHDR